LVWLSSTNNAPFTHANPAANGGVFYFPWPPGQVFYAQAREAERTVCFPDAPAPFLPGSYIKAERITAMEKMEKET
jgi:hypothetical protein